MANKEKVSINTIAREAGVSASTVSRVLTGKAKVNSEKRRKIEEVIRKYNYKPNYASGAAASTVGKILGIVLPDITHSYYAQVFMGAEIKALEKGYTVLLGNTMNDRAASGHKMETILMDRMLDRQVDGLFLLGGSTTDHYMSPEKKKKLCEINRKVPLIASGVVNPPWGGSSIISSATSSIKKAAHYLISLKHRSIGFLGGVCGINPTELRQQALIDVIYDYELEYNKKWIINSGFSMKDGVTAMEKLLQQQEIPTALMCVNDLVAIGAIHSAQKHGLRIPEEISIIGCDNIPLCEYISPSLTTIDLRPRQEGSWAIELLIDAIEGEKEPEEVELESELIIRDSCRRVTE